MKKTIRFMAAAALVCALTVPTLAHAAEGPPASSALKASIQTEGDFAAVATGGTVRIPGWPAETTQVGDKWRQILPQMGADAELADGVLTITGRGRIRGGVFADTSELAPTVAALCALADSPSVLTGIAHLRGHETDRLAALSTEINRLGGSVTETEDGLRIDPVPLHGGTFGTYADHRMATAGAIIGLAVPGVVVEDISATAKTMPEFAQLWTDLVSGAGQRSGKAQEG